MKIFDCLSCQLLYPLILLVLLNNLIWLELLLFDKYNNLLSHLLHIQSFYYLLLILPLFLLLFLLILFLSRVSVISGIFCSLIYSACIKFPLYTFFSFLLYSLLFFLFILFNYFRCFFGKFIG